MGRTSIAATEEQKGALTDAKRRLQVERGEDLSNGRALEILARRYVREQKQQSKAVEA